MNEPRMPLTKVELAAVMDLPKYLRDVVSIAEMAARAAEDLAVERERRKTAERMCKRMQEERNAAYDAHALGKLADELDEDNYASAAKALREAIFMLGKAAKRDAAWARLVKAASGTFGPGCTVAKDALIAHHEALAALRDLGVDVYTLLAD